MTIKSMYPSSLRARGEQLQLQVHKRKHQINSLAAAGAAMEVMLADAGIHAHNHARHETQAAFS